MSLLEPFYHFWRFFSFGFGKMYYRACGMLCLLLFLNLMTFFSFLNVDSNYRLSIDVFVCVLLIIMYFVITRKLEKNKEIIDKLNLNYKKRVLFSIMFVLIYSVVSFLLYINSQA